jgi:outer membrane lipopolysaccharide assembly protein LptE/RlpB
MTIIMTIMKNQKIRLNRFFYVIILACLYCLISACGFHLRSTQHSSLPKIKEVVLQPYDPYNEFYQTLRENLKRAGVDVLLPQANLACPTLTVTKGELSQFSLAYSLQGQTRRERLLLSLSYTLSLPATAGRMNQNFNQKMLSDRDRQVNPNQDLADQYEKTLLEKEMQLELVMQLIQQLGFLPLTESHQCVSISTNSKL